MKDIKLLLPIVQKMTNEFISKCKAEGISIGITSTYRSDEEQNVLYAQGRTTPGSVVTNSKAGYSMHNWKCAIDFCPITNGQYNWNDKALFTKVGNIGKSCGFEWGGDWTSFLDLPHLQYTAGYSLEDFRLQRVEYKKFDLSSDVVGNKTASNLKYTFSLPFEYGLVGNNDVRALQDILRKEGFFSGLSTGNYYDMTASSVMAYQLAHHIAPDSEIKKLGGKRVGQLTINELNK